MLAAGVAQDTIDDGLAAAGFRLVNAVARTDVHFRQRIFARAGGSVYVHDVIDHVQALRYLVLAGVELDGADAELRRNLPILDDASLAPATPSSTPSSSEPS